LSRLKAADVQVHRTDTEGNITFISSGRSISVRTQKPPPEATERTPTAESTPVVEKTATPTVSDNQPNAPININDADAVTLQAFHGIGPSKSAAIVADRTSNGPFASCNDLQRVKGIGPKTVESMGTQCITADNEDPKEEASP